MIEIALVAVALAAAPADNWPAFRGTGDSISQAQQLPLKWSEEENVAWKCELPGYGQSSPVTWAGRAFTTSIEGDNKEKSLVTCVDIASGKLLWTQKLDSLLTAEVSNYISQAAPTPAVDAQRVYAFFETGVLAAFDHDGKLLWEREISKDYGAFEGNHGLGSSLALTEEAVILLVDHGGPCYLAALDKASGKTLWKVDRSQQVSWSSPIVREEESGTQIIVSSNGGVQAYEAASGKQLWNVTGLDGNTVPSATVAGELVIVGSSKVDSNLAIRRGGEGDVTESNIVWRSEDASATFSSPLVYQEHVYLVNRAGVAFCLDAASGKKVWTQRIGDSCWASPLGAEGRVYFFTKGGKTTVVAAGPELKVLAENDLPTEDRVYGVAAIQGKLLVRTGSELVCLADTQAAKGDMEETPAEQTRTLPSKSLGELPKAITSFGGAVLDGAAYVYGGHHGTPHHYSMEGQDGDLLRLDLAKPQGWKKVGDGPRLQGLALESYAGKLYRAGGFLAKNTEKEDQDLWSQSLFASFDPESKVWQDLPEMPSRRSSFDAAVLDGVFYAVGGWAMKGAAQDASWLKEVHAIKLDGEELTWQKIPQPFERRALSVEAFDGKIWAIGGMQSSGKVTRQTSIFDPKTQAWTDGPQLPGDDMEGFGTAAAVYDGRLYVSTISGKLLRLAEDGKSWESLGQLQNARFFHQMLPTDQGLALLAGASMKSGKFNSVEVVQPQE